jgi:hypothetical protein
LKQIPQNYGYSFQYGRDKPCHQLPPTGFSASLPCIRWLCLCQQTVSVYIIRKISQTYFGFGSHQTDCAYQQITCPHRLNSKDMFNPAANSRSIIVALHLTLSQFLIAITFSLNMAAKTTLVKSLSFFKGAVSRIRPNIPASVVFIKKLLKDIAVVNRGWGNLIVANKFMLNIYINMVFITKLIFAVLFYPASICIFLAFFTAAPVPGDITVLDSLVLFSAVTLFWGSYYACINYLALFSGKTAFAEKFIEAIEKLFYKAGFGKLFSKQPDGFSIRNNVADNFRKRIKLRRSLT